MLQFSFELTFQLFPLQEQFRFDEEIALKLQGCHLIVILYHMGMFHSRVEARK
jgi:hypothetical protein